MQIWYFIEFLGAIVFYIIRAIVGWFILGRSCCRCDRRKESFGRFYCSSKYEDECLGSITKKCFKRCV